MANTMTKAHGVLEMCTSGRTGGGFDKGDKLKDAGKEPKVTGNGAGTTGCG